MKRYLIFISTYLATFTAYSLINLWFGGRVDVAESTAFGMGVALFWAIETKV